jgi:hypothetical protein
MVDFLCSRLAICAGCLVLLVCVVVCAWAAGLKPGLSVSKFVWFRKVVDVSESRPATFAEDVSVFDFAVGVKKILPLLDIRNLSSVQEATFHSLGGFQPIYGKRSKKGVYPYFAVGNKKVAVVMGTFSVVGDFRQFGKAFFDIYIPDCCFVYLRDSFPDVLDAGVENVVVGAPFVGRDNGVFRFPSWLKFWRKTQGQPCDPRALAASEVRGLAAYHPPLQDSNNGQNGGEHSNPIGRRFLTCIVSAIAGDYAAEWGEGVCRRRRWLGVGVIAISALGFAASLVLLFLTGFRWSWGWWW